MPKGDETKRDYEILGLENSATEEDVRRSFMKLALKFHPDLHVRPPSDELTKYHEICQAFKRIMTGDKTVSEWNSDKSDEIFFSLLRETLQATLKSGSLYSLFSTLPNHKTTFQDDNEYRCQEDALDDESEETDFNKLLDILKNRLQNGKSVPAGLTKEKIFKLKEEFAKQKDANKKLAFEKGATAPKKTVKTVQVPVTKPKPKTKKQLLAEQRRREKEMAKIAAELEEKKKKESEKNNIKKQLEAEKQRRLDEELKKQEEERKKEFLETKKKREREEREKEAKLQKERDRQEKLRKQQAEEQRRKEEEKKRKAEEKAAKAKSLKEAKDKEEKEKAEQAKKAQQAKRQQQYQQYQQQQQKYPREVPPRFLRQQQLKQQQGLPQLQEQVGDCPVVKQGNTSFQGIKKKDTSEYNAVTSSSVADSRDELNETNMSPWEEPDSCMSESWSQEVTKESEVECSWGGVPVTEDWDAPPLDRSEIDTSTDIGIIKERISEDSRPVEPSPIGIELKLGKIQKKDAGDKMIDLNIHSSTSRHCGFGAVGDRISNTVQSTSSQIDARLACNSDQNLLIDSSDPSHSDSSGEISHPAVTANENSTRQSSSNPKSTSDNSDIRDWKKAPSKPKISSRSNTAPLPGPKLTDWSGLDAFEPVPSNAVKGETGRIVVNTVLNDMKSTTVNNRLEDENTHQKSFSNCIQPSSIDNHDYTTGLASSNKCRDKLIASHSCETSGKPHIEDSFEQQSKFEMPQSDSLPKSETGSGRVSASLNEDEYGWTTASRKTKKSVPTTTSSNKDSNAWVNRSLKQLLDMGFQREDAERALRENNGIIESAVSDLLAGGDTKSSDISLSKTTSGTKEETVKLFGNDIFASNSASSQCGTTAGQPKLNRKQRRKLMQQEQQNARSSAHGDSNGDGEWKLVTREKNVSLSSNAAHSDPSGLKQVLKTENRSSSQFISKTELKKSGNTGSTTVQSSGSVSQKLGQQPAGYKAGIGSELSKSLPVLTGSVPSKLSADSSQVKSHSTSCSASPRSNGSQSPPLCYNSHPQQANTLTNLSFKSLSTDRISQSMSSNSPMSSSSHLFYSDPQLLPEHSSNQKPQFRTVNQSLVKGAPPVVSSIASQSNVGTSPFSLMHILNPQPSVVNSIVGQSSESMKVNYTLPTDELTKGMKPIGPDSSQLPPLTHQQNPVGPSPFHNPLPYSTGAQQSKLLQWKQPISADGKSIQDNTDPTSRLASSVHGSIEMSPQVSSILAPVTVDPVSAKWGVVAAPRLSPTPSEFKPGVPWKPRSEVEKEAREKSFDTTERDVSQSVVSNTSSMSPVEDLGGRPVNSETSLQRSETKPPRPIDIFNAQANENIRPPPGLPDSFAFQNMHGKSVGGLVKKDVPGENSESFNWMILKGCNDKVDMSALKSFCQQYGIVTDFQIGIACISVCFESMKQAAEACKVFNGKHIFDSHFNAEVASEEKVLSLIPPKDWSRTSDSSTPPVDPLINLNQRMTGVWIGPTPINPDPACVMGPTGIGGPIPVNMFGMGPPITQWSGLPSDPTRPTGPFWPLQNGPFIPQVPVGPINLPSQPVTGTGSVVSPSMTKFLPDGLFNGSEST